MDWAEQAGLRRGDKILSIAGIAGSRPEDRAQAFTHVPAGGPLILGISRGGQPLSVSLPCVDDTQLWATQKKLLTAGAHGDWATCVAAGADVQRLQGFVSSPNLRAIGVCADNRTLARGQPLGAVERTLGYNMDLQELREIRYVPEGLDKIRGRILANISLLQRTGFASLAADLETELQKA